MNASYNLRSIEYEFLCVECLALILTAVDLEPERNFHDLIFCELKAICLIAKQLKHSLTLKLIVRDFLQDDGIQLRSKASFSCVGMTPTSAQAFATWPVGKDLVLNGGQIDSNGSSSQASDSEQQASTNFQVTTSRTGDYGSAVVSLEVDGSPVASGSYVAAGKTVNVKVTNVADLSDIKVNGQSINYQSESTGSTTMVGEFVMPSRNTAVTAVFPVDQGGDDFDDGD